MAALAQGAGHLCSKYLMLRKGKQILREKSSLFLCSKKMRCVLSMPLLPTGRTENRHAQRLWEQPLSVLPSSFCDLQSLQFQ